MKETSYDKFDTVIDILKNSINCQLPCKVLAVKGNFVDVLLIRNDEEEDTPVPNVPIKREETGRAYIFLGIKKGDWGTLKFYDKSIEDFIEGDIEYNGDDRTHSLQDRCFELGFIPKPDAFVYPDADIEIGLKDGSAKINLTNGIITTTGNFIHNGVLTSSQLKANNGFTGELKDSNGAVIAKFENGIMLT